ncbi:hypothetical protein BH24ACI3_BH24ACI3_15130 [soil metagenome]
MGSIHEVDEYLEALDHPFKPQVEQLRLPCGWAGGRIQEKQI